MKKIIHKLHLWLGLASSIILFLICLSGTILVFQTEIESFFNTGQRTISNSAAEEHLPLDRVIQKIEQGSKGKVVGLTFLPDDKKAPLNLSVKTSPEERRGKSFIVNPYNGETLNNPDEKSKFFFFFFRLHRWLLLETEIGRPIVGVATLIYSFLLLSGFYLWWPKNLKQFKNSLKINFKRSLKRINYDLHNTLGFYSFIFLLIMSLTGLFWSFEWYQKLGSVVLQTKVFDRGGKPSLISHTDKEKLSYEEILKRNELHFSHLDKISLRIASGNNEALTIHGSKNSFFAVRGTDKWEVNPYSGEVIKSDLFRNKSLGQKIASLIQPIHTGEVFGTFSKIIYFVMCLIGTSLPVTGFWIWFNKRRNYGL